MEPTRRNILIYGLLLGVWLLVVGWQVEEHHRVKESAKTDLRNRSNEIADTLSAVMRALRFRSGVLQDRLEPVLNELVNGRTNDLASSSGLLSIALLNTSGEPLVSSGEPMDFSQKDILQERENWGQNSVIFVNPVWGASVNSENTSNATVVLPPFHDFTNGMPRAGQEFPRREPGPDETNSSNAVDIATTNGAATNIAGERGPDNGPPPPLDFENRPRGNGPRRPPWLRWMNDDEYKALIAKRELHGLVLAMSTENYRAVCTHDLWLRCIITFFAGISAIGVGLAWRNTSKTSELQIRLVRASELNSHLKEMNLAAAGLAHETRNPLNIIRGMAQMISKQADAPAEIREKSRAMVEETDKVTAQLNEFINYSRPREVRRSQLALTSAANEVVRALNYDIEEKKIRLEVTGDPMTVEADEQLFRQMLFNLVLNATQAVDEHGRIQIVTRKSGAAEASLEIRDDGPGVPPERRQEIFKPYFTTHQKGTGLGLAVVQQIILAHGWEIECLANEPKGAVFRITHLKLAG
jgi:signal transduction histidine kinase